MRSGNSRLSADPVGLGAQRDLIGTPEPAGIAPALPAPDGCLPACVIVLVTQGSRDRPARPVAEHPAEWCCGGRAAAASGTGADAPAPATPPCTGQLAA